MDKLKMSSPDMLSENVEKIAALFPNCVTETAEGKAIDFDLLKQELNNEVIEGNKERYRLEWPGKREAIVTANLPTTKTLRPVREDSVDFDNTENLYIEGDNLEVLKLLQESYLGKIKMIYIDPPYNTGKDFVYKDNFNKDTQEELIESGQKDEYNQRLVVNPETAGRYHSDWLSMMYPRLKLARNLLKEEGVIFVNIGEEEICNTEKVLNEIFGESNKISNITRVAKTASNKGTHFAPSIDYLLCYAKSIEKVDPFKDKVNEDLFKRTEINGPREGEKYRDDIALYQSSLDPMRGCVNQRYFIEAPDGSLLIPPGNNFPNEKKDASHIPPESKNDKVWRWSFATYQLKKDVLAFKKTKTSPLLDEEGNQAKYNIYTKSYLLDRQKDGTLPRNFFTDFINRKGADLIKKYGIKFDFSKPIELIEYLLQITGTNDNDLVLDFFSGSCSTAHGVMRWNHVENKKIKFLMVQLPEPIENGEFDTVSEIGKERIRRAGNELKEESKTQSGELDFDTKKENKLDVGFRVYRLDESNMQDVYYKPQDYQQGQLDLVADNVKSDRTPDDLLAQVMLDWGLPLSLKIEQVDVLGKKLFKVAENSLFACFDTGIDEEFAKEIAKESPLRIVFKDSAFKDDTAKVNVKQLLKQLSPETEMKVI
jgi:adenine-specific DNA-methyltransferase